MHDENALPSENSGELPAAPASGFNDGLGAHLEPWKEAATEMVEAYGEMEKGIDDPILSHYCGIRLHNAMEDLRALVLPDYQPKYEPSLDDESDDPRLDTEDGKAACSV